MPWPQPFLLLYSPECVEKLSEKGYERPSEHVFGPIQKPKWAKEPLFCGPEGYTLGASETFQTVSEGEFSEVRLQTMPTGRSTVPAAVPLILLTPRM